MATKKNLQDCQNLAKELGGECLSTNYINSKSNLRWLCRIGHEWESTYDSIRAGSWCPICQRRESNDKKRLNIKDAQLLAQKRGGICLSTEYVNNINKLRWQCKEGHTWETSYSVIKRGHWCPRCGVEKNSKNQRFTIDKAKDLAKNKDGNCLSTEYKNARSNLEWQCKEGHSWLATYQSVKGGSWCPYCAGKRPYDRDMLDEIASKHKGICLSEHYSPGKKVKWQCKNGHIFSSDPRHAKRGHWCPYCAGTIKLTLNHAKKLARTRGGFCRSREYIKSSAKLDWECGNGHHWRASYNSVLKGSWCPICSQGLGERLCRIYFEAAFKAKFPNSRGLSWLKNERGNFLELDGYNEHLKIAFEHQGEHHYEGTHYFSTPQFDDLKKKLCIENEVMLVEVPQIGKLIDLSDLPDLIKKSLNENNRENISLPEINQVDFSDAYHPKWIEELNEIAYEKGGKCLSSIYLGSNKRLKWECKEGHIWMSSPEKIKRGDWCDKCARIESGKNRSLGIDIAKDIAKKRGGDCLSSEYINNRTKLTWQCHKGHTWGAIISNVRKGHWCPICANDGNVKKRRYSIEEARRLATLNLGKCLSKRYINNKTKLLWECNAGHRWEDLLGNIQRGKWCKKCNDNH